LHTCSSSVLSTSRSSFSPLSNTFSMFSIMMSFTCNRQPAGGWGGGHSVGTVLYCTVMCCTKCAGISLLHPQSAHQITVCFTPPAYEHEHTCVISPRTLLMASAEGSVLQECVPPNPPPPRPA
jgi:hypothetical protein